MLVQYVGLWASAEQIGSFIFTAIHFAVILVGGITIGHLSVSRFFALNKQVHISVWG